MLSIIHHPAVRHVQAAPDFTCGWACISMLLPSRPIPSVFSGSIHDAFCDGLSLPDMIYLLTHFRFYPEQVQATALQAIVNKPSIYLMHSIHREFSRPHWFLFEVSSDEDIISIYDPVQPDRLDFDYDSVPSRYSSDLVYCYRILDCNALRHDSAKGEASDEVTPTDWSLA